MRRLIIFLIRKKLGLKRNECFRFANQASSKNFYYFDTDCLMKMHWFGDSYTPRESTCSLNWLLNDDCKIVKVDPDE